jgi:hypothetical protein
MYNIPELSVNLKKMDEYELASYKLGFVDNALFRSVIYKDKKVVCFSPPQSIDYTCFTQNHDIHDENLVIDEIIDGTMINAFYDMDSWKIATRTVVGANCTFYSTKTFHDMFHETNINYDLLDKELCYSFVLQHPENRIVVPIETPMLYLIACYKIQGNTVTEQPPPTFFPIPKRYTFESYEAAKDFVQQQPYTFKGLMLKCDNDRSKIENTHYETIKKLRGNSSNMKYVYYTLRKTENEKVYCEHFPNQFEEYEKELENSVKLLHTKYIECFIKKAQPLKLYTMPLKQHLYELHMIYLHRLKQEKKYVNKKVVWDYINKCQPSQLLTLTQHEVKNLTQN